MGTLLGIAIAILTFLYATPAGLETYPLTTLFISSGLIVLFSGIFLYGHIINPLVRSERGLVPRITEALKHQWFIYIALGTIFAFPLFSIALSMEFGIPKTTLLAVWIALFGITIDAFLYCLHMILSVVNPFSALNLLTRHAYHAINTGNNPHFCEWVESISDTSVRAIFHENTALSTKALKDLEELTGEYFTLNSPLVVLHANEEEVTYTLCLLLQRFEKIHATALEEHQEIIASQTILSLGKVAYSIAKNIPSRSSMPINLIGKLAIRSVQEGLEDVGVKASITLQELGKAILEDDPEMQLPIQDIYFTIIDRLEEISQIIFERNRSINISILTQPFEEIRKMFTDGDYAKHPDANPIATAATNILGSFEALDMVLRTIPTVPTHEEEKIEEESMS